MRLGINVVRLTRPFTGVGHYIGSLLEEWASTEIPFREVVLYSHSPLRRDLIRWDTKRYTERLTGRRLPDLLWEWSALRRVESEVDLLFCPSYTMPLGYGGRCAVTYHGPARHPWWTLEQVRGAAYERLYRYSARRAAHVFGVSESVRQRLVNVYGVPEDRITVTYLAASRHFKPIRCAEEVRSVRWRYFGADVPFVLFVGKISGRHFIHDLIEAFATLVKRRRLSHRLLLVGPNTLGLPLLEQARSAGIADRLVHVPFIRNAELPPVYRAAEFLVYPASETEGFGIPVLEAMACGTPVISTDLGSIAEFARGHALLMRRSTAEEMGQAMERLVEDGGLRDRLHRSGLELSRRFTWRATAEETMKRLWALATDPGAKR